MKVRKDNGSGYSRKDFVGLSQAECDRIGGQFEKPKGDTTHCYVDVKEEDGKKEFVRPTPEVEVVEKRKAVDEDEEL